MTTAYMLIIAIAFSIVAVSLMNLVSNYLVGRQAEDDRHVAESIANALTEPYIACDAYELYNTAREYAEDGQSRVLVLDRFGVVQADTESQLNGTLFTSDESSSVLSGKSGLSGGMYNTDSENGISDRFFSAMTGSALMTGIYAASIAEKGRVAGAVVYISKANEIFEGLRDIRIKTIVWLGIVALIALVLSVLFARMITRPVGELNEGIARMSTGDLSTRVKVRGKNEFAELATAFNSMSERIQALDESRSQFVSNASHELKTPLSTMKILLQTLLLSENNDPNMEKEFLGDIDKEIDRLNRVVSDLLTLVNMDSSMKLVMEDLRIGALVQDQAQRLLPLARENGIELNCIVKDAGETQGDTTKLQQVFYNVIDNAIKYTPRGGSVNVDVSRTGKKIIVKISDTGIGIPEKDISHIFDRFYRVDKARSRETGGTGLGLSIVRQILVLHNGDIKAQSREGEGSIFTIELPVIKAQGAANV